MTLREKIHQCSRCARMEGYVESHYCTYFQTDIPAEEVLKIRFCHHFKTVAYYLSEETKNV